jgi:hypothetical protein
VALADQTETVRGKYSTKAQCGVLSGVAVTEDSRPAGIRQPFMRAIGAAPAHAMDAAASLRDLTHVDGGNFEAARP